MTRLRRTVGVGGVLTLLVAGSAAVASPDLPAPEAAPVPEFEVNRLQRLTAASPLDPTCGDVETAIIDSEVEVHLAVHPTRPNHLLATWQQDRHAEGGGARSNLVATSRNGGRSWSDPITVPGISACTDPGPDPDYTRATDPWAAIGADGVAYLSTLAFDPGKPGDSDDAVLVSASRNGGKGWRPPEPVEAGTHYLEKPVIAADPRIAGRLYAAWEREVKDPDTGETIAEEMRFATSDDGGADWSTATTVEPGGPIDSSERHLAPFEAEWEWPYEILPIPQADGTTALVLIYVTWSKPMRELGTGTLSIRASRTLDAGLTWSESARIATVYMTVGGDIEQVRRIEHGAPSAAVGPDGDLYVTWAQQTPLGTAPGGTEINVARSPDLGLTWQEPVSVASVAAPAFVPTLAVAREGTVGVTWFDQRHDRTGDTALDTDVWFASSSDNGQVWTELHVAGPFDLRQGPSDSSGIRWFLGDYAGLVGLAEGFGALFPMTPPVALGGPSDVFFARIELNDR